MENNDKKTLELEDFEPFDTQTLKPDEYWDHTKIKRIINVLVEKVLELEKKLENSNS